MPNTTKNLIVSSILSLVFVLALAVTVSLGNFGSGETIGVGSLGPLMLVVGVPGASLASTNFAFFLGPLPVRVALIAAFVVVTLVYWFWALRLVRSLSRKAATWFLISFFVLCLVGAFFVFLALAAGFGLRIGEGDRVTQMILYTLANFALHLFMTTVFYGLWQRHANKSKTRVSSDET
jgi:hypothetical protein